MAGGVRIRPHGGRLVLDSNRPSDWTDEIGHGTAVAAAVCEGLPEDRYSLLSVRVFGRRLDAPARSLAAGIRWSLENGAELLNLSAGVPVGSDPEGEDRIRAACLEASREGLRLIAPRKSGGALLIPGALTRVPGVVGVEASSDLDHGQISRRGPVLLASPWARPLPPLPRERNFSGVSLAVAIVTNHVAHRLLRGDPPS